MSLPSNESPNTGNYRVGKGILTFKRQGEMDFRHLGNAPGLEFTPNLTNLDHFSSMEGVKSKDLVIVLEKGGTLKITLEEWTAQNLGIALLGTVDENAAGGPEVEIFSENAVQGELKFTSTNEIGPKWDFWFYNVSFIPSGALAGLSDEWGQIEVTGEVLVAGADDSAHAGKFGLAKLTNLP